ncbi:YetF domain-containing protein [Dyadobacter luticola]|uniref:DUF421 domain-containing protein n=1 Tax=Dyadobacter luticola TaxID=1979387 RepID=A0A5R9KYW5_9BACT|nr:YetF domain-containing protein [Dyadobacter luticola]TLV01496.1 DUF421 domain-containing protein [Dyadobacter luticola]
MKKEDIHFGDWQRVFLGDVPGGFYFEVIFRIAVIYVILMVSMRLMGKRMASQVSRNEMIALVSLAAAIGVPLQAPDRGILAAVIIAAVVILMQQCIARLSIINQRTESLTQGDLTVLINDGQLDLSQMKLSGITREKAFAQLRSRGTRHLGEVKRLYFEAGGSFSFVPNEPAVPGLLILPDNDEAFASQVCKVTEQKICKKCGSSFNVEQDDSKCPHCGAKESTFAVL